MDFSLHSPFPQGPLSPESQSISNRDEEASNTYPCKQSSQQPQAMDLSNFEFEVLSITGCKRRGDETWFEIMWAPSFIRVDQLDRFLSEEIEGVPLQTFVLRVEEQSPECVKVYWHRSFEPENACRNCKSLIQGFLDEVAALTLQLRESSKTLSPQGT